MLTFLVGARVSLQGRVPGHFRFMEDKLGVYFPLATCILLSIVLTGLLHMVERLLLRGR